MRLVHYGDNKGGGTLIISAPKSHVASFIKFYKESLNIDIQKLPKHADPKKGFRFWCAKVDWIFPPARGTKEVLIPAPDSYPCDICEFAQYNNLCQHQKACVPFTYWSLGITNKMRKDDSPDLSAAFRDRFGARSKK